MKPLLPLLIALGTPALADAPALILPVDCTLGEDCFIQQYVDRDPSTGAQDFTCGPLSYDGHQGTDFALPTLADQAAGVDVLAAAAGTVTGIRDEMADVLQTGDSAPDVTGRECGNGVVLDHGEGWTTQYCHMALGSVRVTPGQEVSAGEVLGQIGLSGQTQFPHLHLTLRQDGAVVDPFHPDTSETCGNPTDTLWADPLPYQPGGLIEAGLATAVPEYDAIKAGLPPATLTRQDPLVLWGYLFGGRAGDVVQIDITGPGGPVFSHPEPLTRTQAQLFRAAGLRAPDGGWPPGPYTGTVALIRNGTIIDTAQTAGTID
jgi:hypothetical protein